MTKLACEITTFNKHRDAGIEHRYKQGNRDASSSRNSQSEPQSFIVASDMIAHKENEGDDEDASPVYTSHDNRFPERESTTWS